MPLWGTTIHENVLSFFSGIRGAFSGEWSKEKIPNSLLHPKTVRSLAEEKEKTLTFTSFLRRCTATFEPPMP
jgi:hypothetical protein